MGGLPRGPAGQYTTGLEGAALMEAPWWGKIKSLVYVIHYPPTGYVSHRPPTLFLALLFVRNFHLDARSAGYAVSFLDAGEYSEVNKVCCCCFRIVLATTLRPPSFGYSFTAAPRSPHNHSELLQHCTLYSP